MNITVMRQLFDYQVSEFLTNISQHLPLRRIDGKEDQYLERYYILGRDPGTFENLKPVMGFLPFTIFLHHFLRPDADLELHNHPWDLSYSLILSGGYTEERFREENHANIKVWNDLLPGDINKIAANDFHNIRQLLGDTWTLFVAGKKVQSWGFLDPVTNTFTKWREFLAKSAR